MNGHIFMTDLITYKLPMITVKCLHMPSHFVDMFRRSLAGGSCGRLTAGHSSCCVPRPQDFVVSGPATWNSLPVELRTSSLSSQAFASKFNKRWLLAPVHCALCRLLSNWRI